MLTVWITKGLPASGKSTWAKQQVLDSNNSIKRINNDDLREMLDCSVFSRSNEDFIKKLTFQLVEQILLEGKHVIIDNTNLNENTLNYAKTKIQEIAKKLNKEVVIRVKEFDLPLEECLVRDSKRLKPVGEEVIKRMYGKSLYAKDWKLKEVPKALPEKYIVVDLDGTIANITHRRHYVRGKKKDWNTFSSLIPWDTVRKDVLLIINNRFENIPIVFVSARSEEYRPQTEKWLHDNKLEYVALFMRPANDFRADTIIKKEILDNKLNKDSIVTVIDDRPSVLNMWRSEGLEVVDVGDGEEF